MVSNGTIRAAGQDGVLLKRFATKIFIDVLPAAFTSLLGSMLIGQYQGHTVAPPQPAATQAVAASPEMLRLVHDEHAAIMDYLNNQTAVQKSHDAAEDAAIEAAKNTSTRAVVEAAPEPEVEPASAGLRLAAKPVRHIKVAAAAMPKLQATAPLVVAQADPAPIAAPVVATAPAAAPQPKSLLDKTLDLKDHVMAATGSAARSVVSAIGGLPSFIAGIGDRKQVANLSSS